MKKPRTKFFTTKAGERLEEAALAYGEGAKKLVPPVELARRAGTLSLAAIAFFNATNPKASRRGR